MQEKKIVYILSTGYAGSHFLSLLLGSHSKAMHLGELLVMKKPAPEAGHRECNFDPGGVLSNISPADVPQIYDIIFSRISLEIKMLVDASKKTSWARRFLNDSTYEKKFVHLIRDPRALVRRYAMRDTAKKRLRLRWKIARTYPAIAASIWFAPASDLWMYRWLMQNREITNFIRDNQLDANIVTYCDLATDQEKEIGRLMKWLGFSFEPAQLEYWNKDHIGTQKRNYEWIKDQKTKQHFDTRWKTELPDDVRKRVAANPRVRDYLNSIKVTLGDDGLASAENPYRF
jgi:hypothetical protein